VLQQRRSALGELMARTNDQYQSDEVMRLAALKYADEQLAQAQLNFAPDGTRGLNLAAMRAGLNAQIAANKETRDQKLLENGIKVQNAAREQQIADETRRHNRASEGVEWAKLDLQKDAKGPTYTPEQWAVIHPDNPVPPLPMNEKDYTSFLGARKAGNEISNASPETQRGIPGVTVKDPKTGGERTFVATSGDATEIGKVRTKVAASSTIVHLLDSALRIRDGYSNNNLADRKQWQQLQQIWGAAKAKGKDSLGLGALSGDDYKLLDAYLGSPDPTSFRDPTAGIEQARRTVMLDVNDSLHSVGLPKEDSFDLPNTSKPVKPKDTVADRTLRLILDSPENAAHQSIGPDGTILPPHHSDWEAFPEQTKRSRSDNPRADYHGHGILLQKQALDALLRRATGPDGPERTAAAEDIVNASQHASTSEVRDYAKDLIYGPNGFIAAGVDAIPATGGQ